MTIDEDYEMTKQERSMVAEICFSRWQAPCHDRAWVPSNYDKHGYPSCEEKC